MKARGRRIAKSAGSGRKDASAMRQAVKRDIIETKVPESREKRNLVLEMALYAIGIASITVFWRNSTFTLLFLLLGWLIAMRFWHDRKDIIFFIAAAVIGPLAEFAFMNSGLMSYSVPYSIEMPVWLPLAWGYSAMLVRRFTISVTSSLGWK